MLGNVSNTINNQETYCLSANNLTDDNIPQIINDVNEQANKQVKINLNLSYNQFSDAGLRALSSVLSCPQVIELNLDYNDLGADRIKFLCQILANRTTPLEHLSLDGNPIGEGVENIANLLFHNYPLKTLDLMSCQIPPAGIQMLADALCLNDHLSYLNLNLNTVQKAVINIAQMLATNKKLQHLELNSTELDVPGSLLLGIALKNNEHLVTLNIDCNNLENGFATSFAYDISTNNTFRTYYGPDTEANIIAFICHRNASLPCNSQSSSQFNIDAPQVEKCTQLIKNADPSPSLLYSTVKQMLMQKTLSFTDKNSLTHQAFDRAYDYACRQPIEEVNQRFLTKYRS